GRARVHPDPARAARAAQRLPGRACDRRGAHRRLVRLAQPHARVHRRAGRRAVGLAAVRVPRLPRAPGARPQAARAATACGDLLQPAALRPQARVTAWSAPGEGEQLWFLGTLATIKLPGEAVDGRFALIEFLFPRGSSPPMHTHPQDESYFVLDGRLTLQAG